VLLTDFTRRLERTGLVAGLVRALVNAVRFKRMSGTPWRDVIREALSMKRTSELSWSQVVMAANAPMLLRKTMVEGDSAGGVMASGQVVGVIDDLPSAAELIARIVREAEDVLERLGSTSR
jgi:NAD(P)H-dependent flavin oxidoreductase YrpB (nitropropane dioxygenase family)